MKTTVEIADGLLEDAKAIAQARRTTLRELIQDGLRLVVEREKAAKKPFKLRDGSFGGPGLVKDLDWNAIYDSIYEGRGGNPARKQPE